MSTNNATNMPVPIVVSQGGTGETSFTAYSVICGGTTSAAALQNVSGVGTLSQVLTSAGAGALPTWGAAPATGSIVLLHTLTASSSGSLAFTSTYLTSTYTMYMIVINSFVNASNSVTLNMDWSTNNGSSYLNANYKSGLLYFAYNSTTFTNVNSATTTPLSAALATSTSYSGTMYLTLPQSAIAAMVGNCQTSDGHVYSVGGTNSGTTFINNIEFSYSSGNITSGTVSLYGIVQ